MSNEDKPRISNTDAVEWVVKQLNAGTTFSECFNSMRGKWRLGETTFRKHWKAGNIIYNDQRARINAELFAVKKETAKETAKLDILTRAERQVIATKIARGEGWRTGDEIIMPSGSDRLRALDYLSKLDGDYAPIKTENDTIITHDVSMLTDAEKQAIEQAGDILFKSMQ